MTTGDLVRFPPPVLESPAPVQLNPGESAYIDADFPFPDGRPHDQFNLESLQLRWLVTIGGLNAGQVVGFRLSYPYYNYYGGYYGGPYWGVYAPFPVFTGVVVIGHRR